MVIHDFTACNSTELSIRRGQTVEVLERPHDKPDWCLVRTTDRSPAAEGLVPCGSLCIAHSRSSMEMEGIFNHKGRTAAGVVAGACPLGGAGTVLAPCPWAALAHQEPVCRRGRRLVPQEGAVRSEKKGAALWGCTCRRQGVTLLTGRALRPVQILPLEVSALVLCGAPERLPAAPSIALCHHHAICTALQTSQGSPRPPARLLAPREAGRAPGAPCHSPAAAIGGKGVFKGAFLN